MTEGIRVENNPGWKRFIRKHRATFAVFAVAVALAAAGAVYVLWWFAGNAQATSLVPSTLDLWTMGNIITFALHLIFWELVLIGIPVAVGAGVGWQWWRRLPIEEKAEYHLSGGRSRSRSAEGAISPLLFIVFAIKVYIDGNWDVAISTWTLDYIVGSMITILIWIAVIFAIPAAIGFLWWITTS